MTGPQAGLTAGVAWNDDRRRHVTGALLTIRGITEEEAVAKFRDYAYSRAYATSWLHPLSGMRLVAEVRIQGAHATVLSEMLLELAELVSENKSKTT